MTIIQNALTTPIPENGSFFCVCVCVCVCEFQQQNYQTLPTTNWVLKKCYLLKTNKKSKDKDLNQL